MNFTPKEVAAALFVIVGIVVGLMRCEVCAIFLVVGILLKKSSDDDHDDNHPTRFRFS